FHGHARRHELAGRQERHAVVGTAAQAAADAENADLVCLPRALGIRVQACLPLRPPDGRLCSCDGWNQSMPWRYQFLAKWFIFNINGVDITGSWTCCAST